MNIFTLAACVTLTLFGGSFSAWAGLPLPKEVSVTAPSERVAVKLRELSGAWTGTWRDTLEAQLIVLSIDAERAHIIYSWGDAPKWNIRRGFIQKEARVISADTGTLEFTEGPFVFKVTMGADASILSIERAGPHNTLDTTLKKISP